MSVRVPLLTTLLAVAPLVVSAAGAQPSLGADVVRQTIDKLIARHGQEQAGRIRQGVQQVAQRWWQEDGDAQAFTTFCETSFLADPAALDQTFARLQEVMEQVDGRMLE